MNTRTIDRSRSQCYSHWLSRGGSVSRSTVRRWYGCGQRDPSAAAMTTTAIIPNETACRSHLLREPRQASSGWSPRRSRAARRGGRSTQASATYSRATRSQRPRFSVLTAPRTMYHLPTKPTASGTPTIASESTALATPKPVRGSPRRRSVHRRRARLALDNARRSEWPALHHRWPSR